MDLTEFKEDIQMVDVGHSDVGKFNGANTRRIDFLVFLKGKRTPVSIQHEKRANTLTVEVRGKRRKLWQVKQFSDAFKEPYFFEYESVKFVIKLQVDDEGCQLDAIDLEIQGINFYKHPFVSKDFGKLLCINLSHNNAS